MSILLLPAYTYACLFNKTATASFYLCSLQSSDNLLGIQHPSVTPPLVWSLKEDNSGEDGHAILFAELGVSSAVG